VSPTNVEFAKLNMAVLKPKMDAADRMGGGKK
jgi:hypothetical protein